MPAVGERQHRHPNPLAQAGIPFSRRRAWGGKASIIAAFGVIAALTFAAPGHADDDAFGPTAQQDCTALSWPQPLPNAVGRQLEDIVNDDSFWICLNIAAIAPDGHDVMDDNSGFTQSWRITSQSPEPGTPLVENETITLNVSP